MVKREGIDRIWTAPNVISLSRLVFVAVFVALLFNLHNRFYAFTFLGVAGVTDFFDGYLARRFNQVTKIGKLLDPIVDRVVLATGIIAIVVYGAVPVWLTIVVLFREVFLLFAAAILRSKGVTEMEVLPIGKAGAFGLMFAFPTFLLGHGSGTSEEVFRIIAWAMVVPSIIASYIAAASYLPMAKRALENQQVTTLETSTQ